MMLKKRLSNVKVYNDPYPILEFSNFLDIEESKNATDILKESIFDEMKDGGRKNIRKGSRNFNDFINKNKVFSDIYNFLNNSNTFEYFIKQLKDIPLKSSTNYEIKNLPKKFKPNFYEYKRGIHKNNFFQRLNNYVYKKLPNWFQNLFNFYFFDLIFCYAKKGYVTPIHRDKNSRIIVFLLYLNDLNENDGGCLEIYKNKNKLRNYKIVVPDTNDVLLKHKIKPEAGKLIIFQSNPISFHKAESIHNGLAERAFCYGSYTLNNDVEWIEESN